MANLPQNENYNGNVAKVPTSSTKGFKYTPSTTYQNLAQLKSSGTSPFAPAPLAMPGTPEYFQAKQAGVSQYGNLVNNGLGIPTQTQFLPPVGDSRTPIPIPSDYGTFMDPMTISGQNGEKLSWGTPLAPIIKNIPGDVPGQYVQDTSNPDSLIKTNRGSNPVADRAIRDGRPGFMYQIDHIMPLSLGGADTLANRELLTSDQNDKKTKAQAIPYTLYAHGDISLTQARLMAMQWKDRDLTDIPQPNNVGLVSDTSGKTGIEIAREAVKRWEQPKATTFKDIMANIPEATKNLGEGWLPDPVREFVKGFGSGATFGFLPYEQDDNEVKGSWLAGKVGQVAGGVASFMLGGALIDGALALGGAARGAIATYRGVAVAEAARAGFAGAEVAGELAQGAKIAGTTFKTLNKAPGYLQKILTPQNIQRAAKFGASNVLAGQVGQFVGNKFNPYTLSGQADQKDQEHMIRNIFTDMSIGALSGVGSQTIKGTAYAAMLPLTLTYLANPDDPLDAITNGVIFGAMHAVGSYKNPGFNDVKAFGGKPYENPVTRAFEETANKAAYASLSHYAPDILPTVQSGSSIPKAAHLPETVQQAKDMAIENIWKRFFFGKEVTSSAKNKTLADFKGFAEDLNTGLDSKVPELKGFERLSRTARKERTTAIKDQDANIQKTYGKDYQSKNEFKGDTSSIPGGGMDLQTALTEIKRITVAARQLYKGGLAGEMRNKADVDDLLSFGKGQLQNRFDSMEKFVNPPIAKQAVDSIDESFMQKSFNNDKTAPSGKYPTGDIALTGSALKINKAEATYFFEQRKTGNASPNILLIDRSDTAPLWRMRNQLLDPNDIKAKNYAPDINPDNALQAFGVVKNPKTGAKELIPLGWVASDFRLNQATGKGHEGFNQHPLVKTYKETQGAEGMKPIDLHKDQIVPAMRKEGVSVLVANLDPRATVATVESGNPFIPVNINDQNWSYSKSLGDRMSQQGNNNPVSMAIAKVNNAIGAKQKSQAISEMNKKIVKPASAYIPITPEVNTSHLTGQQIEWGKKALNDPDIPQYIKENIRKEIKRAEDTRANRLNTPQEATRTLVQGVERSLDVASPIQIKEAFKKNFGILLEDTQATEMFNRRNEITLRDGVKFLVDAYNKSGGNIETDLRMRFMKTYLESGALHASDGGKAVADMLLLGKMENNTLKGQEEHITTQSAKVIPPEPAPVLNIKEPVTQPTDTLRPSQETPAQAVSPEPSNGLINRIVTNAQRELPATKRKTPLLPSEDVYSLAKGFIPEGITAIENATLPGQRYTASDKAMVESATKKYAQTHDSVISDMEKVVQASLQGRNLSPETINEVKRQVRTTLENHSSFILGSKDPVRSTGELPPKPQVKANEFYKSIDTGLKSKELPAYYSAKTLDTVFSQLFGKDYKKNPTLAKFLSTIHPWGADFWNNRFFNELNSSGREIQQNRDIINARASGDRGAEMKAYGERRKQLQENPTGEGGNLSDAERSQLGIGPEQSNTGMRVVPWYQEDNMVGNLTHGENLMSGVVSDMPLSGASAVRDMKRLFIGVGKDSPGLLQYINSVLAEQDPKFKKHSISASLFEKLEKEAVVADAQQAIRSNSIKEKTIEANKELPQLKKQYQNLLKDIEGDPENPPPAWQTPELMQETLKDITEKIAKYSKIIEETKGDGAGGPGIHDGRRGRS